MNQALSPGAIIITTKDFCLSTDQDFRGTKTVYKDCVLAITIAVDHEMTAILAIDGRFGWTVKISCMTTL